MKLPIAVFAVSMALTGAQQKTTAEALFREALVKERAEGNLPQAIFLYERLIAEFSGDRPVRFAGDVPVGVDLRKATRPARENAAQTPEPGVWGGGALWRPCPRKAVASGGGPSGRFPGDGSGTELRDGFAGRQVRRVPQAGGLRPPVREGAGDRQGAVAGGQSRIECGRARLVSLLAGLEGKQGDARIIE